MSHRLVHANKMLLVSLCDFNVVDGGGFGVVEDAVETEGIARFKVDAREGDASAGFAVRMEVGPCGWKNVVGDPLADGLMVEFEAEVGFAGPVVEVLDGNVVGVRGFVKRSSQGAAGGVVEG